MKKFFLFVSAAIMLTSLNSCVKDKVAEPTPPANPLTAIEGNWGTQTWGGIANNNMGITIDGTLKTGVIKIVGPTTLGYTVGESFFTNLAATSTSASTGVYTGDVTYHAGTTTGKSPSTITLQNGGKEILIHIAPVGTTQSPDIILSKN